MTYFFRRDCRGILSQPNAFAFPKGAPLGLLGLLQVFQHVRFQCLAVGIAKHLSGQVDIMQAGKNLAHLAMGFGIKERAGTLCQQAKQAQLGLVVVFRQALQGAQPWLLSLNFQAWLQHGAKYYPLVCKTDGQGTYSCQGVEKLLTFAIGRGIEYDDAPAVRRVPAADA